jgi:DNA-binding GntR family transcriptional regulator
MTPVKPMGDDLVLRIDGLEKTYPLGGGAFAADRGSVRAVDNVSFANSPRSDAGAGGRKRLRQVHRCPAGAAHRQCHQWRDLVPRPGCGLVRPEQPVTAPDPPAAQEPADDLSGSQCLAQSTDAGVVGEPLRSNALVPKSEVNDRVADALHMVGLRPEYMNRYRLARLLPDDAVAFRIRAANLMIEAGQTADGLALLRAAAGGLDPSNGLLLLGQAHAWLLDHANAETCLAAVCSDSMAPVADRLTAQNLRFKLFAMQRKLPEAIGAWEAARALDIDHDRMLPDLLRVLIYWYQNGRLKAVSLTEAAADELRRRIIDGRIKTGTKVTERDVATLLGIGRMPAREALMSLEHEGLITSKSEARYVLELTPERIKGLYKVRSILEHLAVTQAAENTTAERALRLEEELNDLRFACEREDATLTTPADLALHEEIWAQADNPYLERCLRSMRGVVFLTVMQGSLFGPGGWDRLFQQHRDLISAINAGNPDAAGKLLMEQLSAAQDHSVEVEQIVTEEAAQT